MSLYEALKGARVELAALPSPMAKLHRAAGIAQTFCSEILQQFLVIPYAMRAISTYRSLPRLERASARPAGGVSLLTGLRYGPKQRNVVDVYLPPGVTVADGVDGSSGAPVALFCHGGVWAAGDKWHYAPMATRLAGAGVLTLVMHYSLYPEALVPEMTDEVNAALSWTLDNAASLGGDPARVSLVGHSAGAQLAMMALLHRAKHSVQHSGQRRKQQPAAAATQPNDFWRQDGRMPRRLVGALLAVMLYHLASGAGMCPLSCMAGVYDLTQHFEYESRRGVGELSTMKRAAGGAAALASVSPVVILARALAAVQGKRRGTKGGDAAADRRPQLRGEALSHRIGFERPRGAMAQRLAAVVSAESASETEAGASAAAVLQLTRAEVARLPPTVLMSSCADIVVPWYESAEMYWMLHDCGVPCKHLVDLSAGHGDYVVTWRAPPRAATRDSQEADMGDDLPAVARDVLLLVSEQVEPAWN